MNSGSVYLSLRYSTIHEFLSMQTGKIKLKNFMLKRIRVIE